MKVKKNGPVLQALDKFALLENMSSITNSAFSLVNIPDRPINTSISSFYK